MTSKVTRALGVWGEEQAARYCHRLGWTQLDRNWRCRAGELDLVMRQRDGTVVFIEVKCRSSDAFGDPLEAITEAKVAKVKELANWWLREHRLRGRPPIRVDAIGVLRTRAGVELRHVKGIVR